MLRYHGKMRVYFNKHGDAPFVWCVAPDEWPFKGVTWELPVTEIQIEVPAITRYQRKETPDDEDGKPSAWFEVTGQLEVDASGFAVIK